MRINEKMKNNACFTSKSDQWATPEELYRGFMINGFFDPCPLNPEPVNDGLSIEWKEKNFVNPPYSCVGRWVRKACYESKNKYVVLLVPSRTDAQWFKEMLECAHHIWFVIGRLRFGGSPNPAPFPSCLVLLGPKPRHLQVEWLDREELRAEVVRL